MKIRQAIRSHSVIVVGGILSAQNSCSSWSPELQDPKAWVLFSVGEHEILICRAYFISELASLRYAVYYLTRLWSGRKPNGP